MKRGMMRICHIRHSIYPEDPRLYKETQALLEAGHQVDIICIKKNRNQKFYKKLDRLCIFRIPVLHKRENLPRYIFEYSVSFLLITIMISFLHAKNRYHCIQVNSMPNFFVFTTYLVKLFGAKVLLDLYEPIPELWITKYNFRGHRFIYHLLVLFEQKAIQYADASFTVTETIRQRFKERGADVNKMTVIPNVSEESKLKITSAKLIKRTNQFTIITHGLIEKRYGHEVIVRAVNILKDKIPELRFNLCGDGSYKPDITELINNLGCNDQIKFFDFMPYTDLLQKIKEADVGIIAMFRTPYSELIDTNKMYEYIALNIPVITSRLPAIEYNFDNSCLIYFTPGDPQDLARCILELYNNPEKRKQLTQNAFHIYEKLRWNVKKYDYLKVIESFNKNK